MQAYTNLILALAIASFTVTSTGCGSAPNGPISLAPTQLSTVPQTGMIPTNGLTTNGCVPLNQPIGFQANGMYIDNQSIYAGVIPPYVDKLQPRGGIVGQVITSAGGPMSGAYQPVQNQLGTLDGNIALNAMQTTAIQGQVGIGMAPMGNATGSGTITLSRTKLQIIYGLFGLNYANMSTPYSAGIPQYGFPNVGMPFNAPGMTQTQLQQQVPCVSGIAISLSHYGTTLYGGRVYLYLNGQQHGDFLQF